MNVYTEGKTIERADCLDVLTDMEKDLRGLFLLTHDAATSDSEDEPWAYSLISDMTYQMAETLRAVVDVLKSKGAANADC